MIATVLVLMGSLLTADARSTVLLRYACENDLGRRDVTLFANGTVRLREGLWEEQNLYLDELSPEELKSTLDHLASLDTRGQVFDRIGGNPVEGEWVEACEVELDLPGREPASYAFRGFDLPALVVTQLIHVADGLAVDARPTAQVKRLPADYEPQPGDILQTVEGDRFRVLRFTVGSDGVELDGLDQPLRIYVARSELHEAFATIVKAAGPR